MAHHSKPEWQPNLPYISRVAENMTRHLLLDTLLRERRQAFAHGDSIRALQLALELAQSLPARTRIELELRCFKRMGDAHFALGAMSDSALAYETAAARAGRSRTQKDPDRGLCSSGRSGLVSRSPARQRYLRAGLSKRAEATATRCSWHRRS